MEALGLIAAVIVFGGIAYLVKRSRDGNKVDPRDVADKIRDRFK
jgi:hypothetical protein